jgi:hypothetical protein
MPRRPSTPPSERSPYPAGQTRGRPRKSPPAPKGSPYRAGQTVGRPTGYKPIFAGQAYQFCLLGLTDERVAQLFGVSLRTLVSWRATYPKFKDAFERGRERADAAVANALVKKAVGFERVGEKVFLSRDGQIVRAPTVEYFAPDFAAQAFYLSNRQRELWKRDPVGSDIHINMSLEALVMDAIRLRQAEDREAAKTIEHSPAEGEPAPNAVSAKTQD